MAGRSLPVMPAVTDSLFYDSEEESSEDSESEYSEEEELVNDTEGDIN